jgi:hypothetical protein
MITSVRSSLAAAVKARDEPSSKKSKSSELESKMKDMGKENQALLEAMQLMVRSELETKMEGVDKSLIALADATDQGFSELKQDLDTEKKSRVASQEENDKKLKEVQEEVQKLSSGGSRQALNPGSSRSSVGASRPPVQASTPYDQRVAASGNLGWDCSKEDVTTRAKDILEKAGIKPDDYVGLSASFREKGSSAELCFNTASLLQKAKFAISDLDVSHRADKAPVWLNVEKDREELRPARVVHRITDLIQEAESGRSDAFEVEKAMNGKKVLVGPKGSQHMAGYSNKGVWMWTQFSRTRYNQEFLDMAKAYAEDD